MSRPNVVFGFAAVLSTLAAGLVLTVAIAHPSAKDLSDPVAGLSDAEKQAFVDKAHADEFAWAQAFVASGRNLRSLKPVEYEAWAGPVTSLQEATESADLIVHAKVERAEFSISPDGGLPVARTTVRVMSAAKGTASRETILVRQLGGPILWANQAKGGLAYLATDELILAGDEVILSLKRDGEEYSTIPGRGIYFVRDGKVVPARSNQAGFDLAGLRLPEALGRIMAPAQP